MTTSIPTKSPDLNVAAATGSAASYFGGDTCANGAQADFGSLLDGNTAATTPANPETSAAGSVLAGAAVAPALAVSESETEPAVQQPSQEAIEQAAALIASLWSVLQSQQPVQPTPSADVVGTDAATDTTSAPAGGVKVTLQWGDQNPITLTLPASDQPPADLAEQVSEQISALFGDDAAGQAGLENASTGSAGDFPVAGAESAAIPELTISLNIAPAVQADANVAKGGPKVAIAGAEKFAGKIRLPNDGEMRDQHAAEKNFLSTSDEEVTNESEASGIDVAKSERTMPAFFATRQITPERFESAAHSWMSDSASLSPVAESASVPTESAAAASLARRAVDTIQNVIETQHIRTDHQGVVSLNFKFGSDDLAVRVQLRDGEVHTQFRTDSAELRAALADEWHALVVGQGSDQGSRLIEPVFAPSNSSLAQQHAGSGSSGQGFAQKQQQEAQAPFALPEVRTFRRGLSAATAAAAEVAPQIARALPTSLHFTAFA